MKKERHQTGTRFARITTAVVWMLLVGCGSAMAQGLPTNFDANSGSYIRARLLHAAPSTPLRLPARGSQNTDPWLGFDKVQHATFGFLFTLGGQYVLVNKAELSEGDALPLSIGFAVSAGLAKEVWDRRRGTGVFSVRDLVADGVGILLATTIILI